MSSKPSKPKLSVTICGARKMQPETVRALAHLANAVYAHDQKRQRCINRGAHMACGKR